MKSCSRCKKTKEDSEFYKNRYECVLCTKEIYNCNKDAISQRARGKRKNDPEWAQKEKERLKKYRLKNREIINKKAAAIRKSIPSHILKEKAKNSYLNNKNKILSKSKIKRDRNIEEARLKSKENYAKNRERILENAKRLRRKYYPKRNEQSRIKRKTNPLYRFKTNLRSSIYKSFARISSNKPTNTSRILGADYDTVKNHIESKFTEGMTWNNYGTWDVDHIIPLVSAKTQEELLKLCHYTNLQPLWEYDNIIKGGKIILE